MKPYQANILTPHIGCGQCHHLMARVRELTAERDAARQEAARAEMYMAALRDVAPAWVRIVEETKRVEGEKHG